MNNEVLGYDCDGNELFEFDVIRAIWYSDIDFNVTLDVDPRHYCVVQAFNGKTYLISVYDSMYREFINKYEKRNVDADVPIKIMPIEEADNYEVAYKYDFDKNELKRMLNRKLGR